MGNIFGLSFSEDSFCIVHFENSANKREYKSSLYFAYPFSFQFDTFFNDDNLSTIITIINKQKEKLKINEASLHLSLPLNFAILKRITIPLDMPQEVIKEQIEWELQNYLPEPLTEYKVLVTDNSYLHDTYKEVLIISIKKTIVEKTKSIAVKLNANLESISLNHLSLENYLQYHNLIDSSKNQIIFKIGTNLLETHLFACGKYYFSYLDNIRVFQKEGNLEQKLVEITTDRYKQCINLAKQIEIFKRDEFQLFAYGSGLENNIYDKLKNNFTSELNKISTDIYDTKNNACPEAIGATLNASL